MCEALTRTFTTCNGALQNDSGLCSMHQDYYTPDTWMKNWLTHPQRDNVVLLGYQKGSTMRNLEDHIRYATKEKIRIPESFVQSIQAHPKYTDLYLLLCENEYIDPLWNKKLLRLTFVEFLKRRKTTFAGFWPNVHRHFESLLRNPNMGITHFFFKFLEILLKLKKQGQINPYYQDIEYKGVIDEFFSPEDNTLLDNLFYNSCLASKEHLISLTKCSDTMSNNFFIEIIYPYFQAKKKVVRQKRKEEFDEFKREIVEIVYHPQNVERWLETGGWELFEMMT